MVLSKIDFLEYTEMDERQRKDYAQGWLYIYNRKIRAAAARR